MFRLARDFDQRFDNFWEILHNRSEALVADRSYEVLKWHFSASLDKNGSLGSHRSEQWKP